ncbi:type IV toxin-antitoxin system AbiEi family antitoxin [Massilia sp. CF038]|uniref:type IV toxin-antitoxin system AbiEi family antitoxin n=1 Tax=Massilia sp. CF038 TaxID=1881045 RepID=UPI000920C600|nr:type IV toxin-antitoxin system AbiEi family antitoxin [Massilia sp. CF038]SHH40507.1 hypothetical protein SAMN05428948_3859 [Massilia sp. CF038]
MGALITGVILESELLEHARAALRERLDIETEISSMGPYPDLQRRHDAEIDLFVQGEPRRYAVECKTFVDRRDVAQQVKQQLKSVATPGLLITSYLSKEMAAYCRDIDLQFIDTHGNAFLKGPGLLVYVTGERRETGAKPGRSTGAVTTVAGLRVAFTLLTSSGMVAAPYREIASKAGVSLGAVSNAVEDLERRGYVISGGAGKRRALLEPEKLLEEWTLNYPIQLRPKLNGRRYSVPSTDWWKDAQLDMSGAVWGGEVAAHHLTGYLKPATQTIYVAPAARGAWLKGLVTTYRAKPDPNGSLEVLDKFWGEGLESGPGIAPFALVYADLLASLDPRSAETAHLMRKEWTNGDLNPA